MEVSAKGIRNSKYFKDTFDGLRVEVSAARVIAPDGLMDKGWNMAMEKAMSFIDRYAAGRGLFQLPTELAQKFTDYVHERDGQFYFWDETEVNEIGPYATKQDAVKALDEYIRTLNKEKSNGEQLL